MSIITLKDGSTVRTYQASSGGTGYASGDVLLFVTPKIQTNPVTTGNTYWLNAGPGANAETILPSSPTGQAEITIADIVEQTTLGDILKVIAGPLSVSGNSSGTLPPGSSPISGTVTSNQGTAATTSGAWPVKVTDGTNVAAVKAANTNAVATDPSAVVQLSPNGTLPAPVGSSSASALPVIGLSRQITTSGTSASQALSTSGFKAITLTARNASLFYTIANGSATAVAGGNVANAHWLAAGASRDIRIDLVAMPAPVVAAIQDTAAGTCQIDEWA